MTKPNATNTKFLPLMGDPLRGHYKPLFTSLPHLLAQHSFPVKEPGLA